ncbi:MAG: protein kinase [Planctomycetota bacterium]|nr:protein kinase [Planctomycetota bacterium]
MSQAGPPSDEAFAAAVLRSGLVSPDRVEAARMAQAEAASRGVIASLADILVQQGAITAEQRENLERQLLSRGSGDQKRKLGNYRLVRKLGEGGMGAVYLAEDEMIGRLVAVKILPKHLSSKPDRLARFYREAKAAGKLNHPNIAAAFTVGEEKGVHYYVMEYCEGETLDRTVRRLGYLPERAVLKIGIQVAAGLQYAHSLGFVHRDIKPSNIIACPPAPPEGLGGEWECSVKILDMGLTKNIADEEASFNTASGVMLGTPHYVSPEQARGDREIDGRTDIYSLGASMYHLMTGRAPFEGETPVAVMMKHITEQIPDPREYRPEISEASALMLARAMAKDPDDRYADAGEMMADMERALAGEAAPGAGEMGFSSVALRRAMRAVARDLEDVELDSRIVRDVVAEEAPMLRRTGKREPVAAGGRTPGAGMRVATGRTGKKLEPVGDRPREAGAGWTGKREPVTGERRGATAAAAQDAGPGREPSGSRGAGAINPYAVPLAAWAVIGGAIGLLIVIALAVFLSSDGDRADRGRGGVVTRPEPAKTPAVDAGGRQVQSPAFSPAARPGGAGEEERPIEAYARRRLEAAKSYLKEHPDDPWTYRDMLADIAAGLRSTAAGKEAAGLLATLKLGPRPELKPIPFRLESLRSGCLLAEYYDNIPGYSINDLMASGKLEGPPSEVRYLLAFETPANRGDNYGTRIRGLVLPPATGDYVFWIASDDASELYLGPADNPERKARIAFVQGYTGPREWTREPGQQSKPVRLEGGKAYYIEALHKEGGGDDHLAVGWRLPDGKEERPIPLPRLMGLKAPPIPPPKVISRTEPVPTAPGEHKLAARVEVRGRVMDFPYLIYLPAGYAPPGRPPGGARGERPPLLMFLHGVGECGTDLQGIYVHGPAPELARNQAFREKFPFIVFCPQCAGGLRWEQDLVKKAVLALLEQVIQDFGADPDRIYCTGLSMGGTGTWHMALEAPTRFAAIAPISGYAVKPEIAKERLAHLGIWIITGGADGGYTEGARQMAKAFEGSPKVTFTVHPGEGHGVWTRHYQDPQFYLWFLKHRRSPIRNRRRPGRAGRRDREGRAEDRR